MEEWIISIMNNWGYFGIGFLIIVENLFPPIPSEVILTFGGFMTHVTDLSVPGVILVSTVSSTVGAYLLYGLGSFFPPSKFEKILDTKLMRHLGFKKGDVNKTVSWFLEKGKLSVLFGRCLPIIRSLISIPAGMGKMHIGAFTIYTFVGSLLWNTILVSLGAFAGQNWKEVLAFIESGSVIIKIILVIIFIALVILFFYYRHRKKEDNEE